ncbi:MULTISPECIES: Bug family tripartite tricarboxylate transporter substrate binding protein [Achromobacter]|jgi:tripartite-type tricarboxylate transporter receptor subunit TctC|uniref:Tripartite tricarboxylate transporter substrate binding protein n=1 Tax=Achromobacter aegrifaciens TaxID=1287736 RepID=A0ABU2DA45_ACHAE|nr:MULTISPECIES: tripartite tricarboxylate transporter substrate binding protein [Achromobacter]MBD9380662.1 tripartite tricarboxylate transporter substrate binding protein [Achromobacter sp. ACM02]MBD9419604.1 tripartite tricarboxylate transporter substrate binding protein [Achromobacter sp. ACM04]MBD9433804.1 tripartite tricarboxylate transporter substrate binding protein [Achromobacter sp. ACM03]MBD9476784.1 tripartite tricarboxylate transporter substrate binding protein [Achromobacter sp. A
MKTRLLAAMAAGALCLSALAPVQAQTADWPNKPLRLLVGSAPGGGTDAMARAVADKLGPLLKQTVVVENKPGASNTLAADLAAKSTDGHTMVMGVSTAHAIAPHLLKLGYDNDRDLTPVVFVGAVPNILVVNNDVPAKSVQELIALLKSKPGTYNFASSGSGSTQHIAAELFKDATGVQMIHIPYRGSGPALVDLMGGQVQIAFETASSVIPHIKSGKVRALAVLSAKRNAQLPDVPTMAEAGVPGVEMSAWYGIYMPSATPAANQKRIHDAVNGILALPDTQARLQAIGADINPMSQEQFAQFHKSENQRYAGVIKKNNISVE